MPPIISGAAANAQAASHNNKDAAQIAKEWFYNVRENVFNKPCTEENSSCATGMNSLRHAIEIQQNGQDKNKDIRFRSFWNSVNKQTKAAFLNANANGVKFDDLKAAMQNVLTENSSSIGTVYTAPSEAELESCATGSGGIRENCTQGRYDVRIGPNDREADAVLKDWILVDCFSIQKDQTAWQEAERKQSAFRHLMTESIESSQRSIEPLQAFR